MTTFVWFNWSVTEELVRNAIAGSCVRIVMTHFSFFLFTSSFFSALKLPKLMISDSYH